MNGLGRPRVTVAVTGEWCTMRQTLDIRGRRALHYPLDTLQALPCGCVAAIYRAQPLDAEVVAVEARGPHCLYFHHQVGQVLGLAVPDADRPGR